METIQERVVALVSHQASIRLDRLNPGTTLFGDLGIDGDDGAELLQEFGQTFSVDMSACRLDHYFGPEASPPWAVLYWVPRLFRRGTAEEKVGLQAITIGDLVRIAESGRWSMEEK